MVSTLVCLYWQGCGPLWRRPSDRACWAGWRKLWRHQPCPDSGSAPLRWTTSPAPERPTTQFLQEKVTNGHETDYAGTEERLWNRSVTESRSAQQRFASCTINREHLDIYKRQACKAECFSSHVQLRSVQETPNIHRQQRAQTTTASGNHSWLFLLWYQNLTVKRAS